MRSRMSHRRGSASPPSDPLRCTSRVVTRTIMGDEREGRAMMRSREGHVTRATTMPKLESDLGLL